MIELNNNELSIRFPEVHEKAECNIFFERMVNVDQNIAFLGGKNCPMSVSRGKIPLSQIQDSMLLKINSQEKVSIGISGDYPIALKIGRGNRNTLSGKGWCTDFLPDSQDYLVSNNLLWLDYCHLRSNDIRQYIEPSLEEGFDEMKIVVYPMNAEVYAELMTGFLSLRDIDDKCVELDAWVIASASSYSLMFSD